MTEPIDWTPPAASIKKPKAAFHNNIALMRNHIRSLEAERRKHLAKMEGLRSLADSLMSESMPYNIADDPKSVGRYIKDLLNE